MGGIGNNSSQTVGIILWDRSRESEEGMLASGHRPFLQQMCSVPAISTGFGVRPT